jgi:muramoyltetrapeptide carboxypeptidase
MGARRIELIELAAAPPGAGIGVIAPASFARPERIERGLAAVRALGFEPRALTNALARGPLYFAGTTQQRLADLHAAFEDQSTAIVMCLRGGYGSNYLLEGLKVARIGAHPKPFFAYSDLTGIQLRLLDELGLPAFHGPMLAADFYLEDGVHLESFRAALSGEACSVGAGEGLRTLKAGTASGVLYGGCLSMIVSLLGTPWEPHTEGTLLFVEDVGVKPYQIDRLIWQLRNAGKLDGVTGIVFGEMLDCVSAGAPLELVTDAIMNALDGFEGPVACGLRSGHVSRQNVTLTFGIEAQLTAGVEASLEMGARGKK